MAGLGGRGPGPVFGHPALPCSAGGRIAQQTGAAIMTVSPSIPTGTSAASASTVTSPVVKAVAPRPCPRWPPRWATDSDASASGPQPNGRSGPPAHSVSSLPARPAGMGAQRRASSAPTGTGYVRQSDWCSSSADLAGRSILAAPHDLPTPRSTLPARPDHARPALRLWYGSTTVAQAARTGGIARRWRPPRDAMPIPCAGAQAGEHHPGRVVTPWMTPA